VAFTTTATKKESATSLRTLVCARLLRAVLLATNRLLSFLRFLVQRYTFPRTHALRVVQQQISLSSIASGARTPPITTRYSHLANVLMRPLPLLVVPTSRISLAPFLPLLFFLPAHLTVPEMEFAPTLRQII